MSDLLFYFDESVELAVSEQLVVSGLDAVSAHSLDKLGDEDSNHLQRATNMQRVLCTYDMDFLRLAQEKLDHSGIIFAFQQSVGIGDWVRYCRALHLQKSAENLYGLVLFLSGK